MVMLFMWGVILLCRAIAEQHTITLDISRGRQQFLRQTFIGGVGHGGRKQSALPSTSGSGDMNQCSNRVFPGEVKFVFSPPASGKTTFLSYINNPFHSPGNIHGYTDADDILSRVIDTYTNRSMLEAMPFYSSHGGWNVWNYRCVRDLIGIQRKSNLGPILLGFMVGQQFDIIDKNLDLLIGDGYMDDVDKSPMLRPDEIIIVLPTLGELAERGKGRIERVVSEEYSNTCLENYLRMAKKYCGKAIVISDLSELDTACSMLAQPQQNWTTMPC